MNLFGTTLRRAAPLSRGCKVVMQPIRIFPTRTYIASERQKELPEHTKQGIEGMYISTIFFKKKTTDGAFKFIYIYIFK